MCVIALTGTYVKLAIVASVAIVLVYLASCIAAALLRRRDIGSDGNPFRMPWGSVVPWAASGLLLWLLVQATPMAWLLTGAVVAVASLAFVARAARRPSP